MRYSARLTRTISQRASTSRKRRKRKAATTIAGASTSVASELVHGREQVLPHPADRVAGARTGGTAAVVGRRCHQRSTSCRRRFARFTTSEMMIDSER
jgi:hypothetical protein